MLDKRGWKQLKQTWYDCYSEVLVNILFSLALLSPRISVETQSRLKLLWVLGSDCLYTCVLDALWVSQRETVRALTDAKFKSLQVESHKLQSVQRWSGSVLISIPIHCGFIAYLFLAHGKHFPNNIYSSQALARWVFLLCPSCKRCVWVRCDTDDGLVTSQDRSSHGLLTRLEISRSSRRIPRAKTRTSRAAGNKSWFHNENI